MDSSYQVAHQLLLDLIDSAIIMKHETANDNKQNCDVNDCFANCCFSNKKNYKGCPETVTSANNNLYCEDENMMYEDNTKKEVVEEFKASDIFSDLSVTPEVERSNDKTTQTSQSFLGYIDSDVQTSQSLLSEMRCGKVNSSYNTSTLPIGSPKYIESIARRKYNEGEQIVPDIDGNSVLLRAGSGIRRTGLSKKARLNSLHRKKI